MLRLRGIADTLATVLLRNSRSAPPDLSARYPRCAGGRRCSTAMPWVPVIAQASMRTALERLATPKAADLEREQMIAPKIAGPGIGTGSICWGRSRGAAGRTSELDESLKAVPLPGIRHRSVTCNLVSAR